MDAESYIELRQTHGATVRKIQGGWMCTCPAHDDHTPSLSVTAGDDDRILLHCHAGCTVDQVLTADGLQATDLFAERHTNGRVEMAVYTYVDEHDTALYEVVRFQPKDFRQRQPNGEWGIGDIRRVPFRLPRVLQAVADSQTVYVVEGEKDVLALERAGVVATCNPGGAGKWRPDYSEFLRGADVVVVADCDNPGRDHARQVTASLEQVGATVEIVHAAVGKDASDHLQAGKQVYEFVAGLGTDKVETGERAPHDLAVPTLDEFIAVDEPGATPLLGGPDAVLVPANGDAMVYGDGGAGKTTLTIDLGFHLAAGDDWLGIPIPQTARVLLVENEGPRPLLRRKLARKRRAWGGNGLGGRLRVFERPWGEFSLEPESWRDAIAAAVTEHNIDVLIAGPLTRIGMNDAGTLQEVRAFMGLVHDLRERCGRPLTVLLIHHENKGGQVSGAWEGSGDTLLHVQGAGNGHTLVYVQKARWDSTRHGTTMTLAWEGVEGFELEGDRDYPAEAAAWAAENGFHTIKEIAAGIRAGEETVRGIIEDEQTWEMRTGDAARALNRNPNAKLYGLRSGSSADMQTCFFPTVPDGSSGVCAEPPPVGRGSSQRRPASETDPNQNCAEGAAHRPPCSCVDGGLEGDQPGLCSRCMGALKEMPF